MFEDNPFYTPTKEELASMKEAENQIETAPIDESISIDENTEQPTDTPISNEEMSYEVKFIDNDIPVEPSKNDKIDAVVEEKVQTPETPKVEEKQSTGVSSYTEVPDINDTTKQTTKYETDNTQAILVALFVLCVFIINKFKKSKYIAKLLKRIPINKIANITHKFFIQINFAMFLITILFLTFPGVFNVGTYGQLAIFPLLLIGGLAMVNGNVLSKKICLYCKTKEKFVENKIYTFPGLNILRLSLTLFAITSVLFFSLTESSKILGIIYLLVFGNIALLVLSKDPEEISNTLKNKKKNLLFASAYLVAIGIIVNSYIITILSSILTGYSIIFAKEKE